LGFGQCVNNSLNLGNDTTLCIGDSLTIQAPANYLSYLWNTGSVNSSITVGTTGPYICTVQVFDTTNLVVNGDFSTGNTGFTSNYIYGTGGTWGLLSNPGQYAVSTNANLTHNNFVNCTDHTTGTGNYMIMNGSSIANTNVWCQTIAVSPATTYVFSAWFTSVVSSNPASLNFSINGTTVGSVFNLSTTTCNWQSYFQVWTSGPAQTSATICITNQNIAGGGNDFAIDDIWFSKICQSVDTLVATFDAYPNVNLGNDTVICPGNNLVLDATDDPGYNYIWNDGTATAINTVSTTDSNLVVSVSNGNCTTEDTIIVTVSAQPVVDLGNDSTLCPGDTLSLDASWPSATYLWNDNSNLSNLNATQTGQYWVQVTDNCGATSDTVNATYVPFPLVGLGNDTTLCTGETLSLDATHANATYLWNNNTTSPILNVNQTGQYAVSVTVSQCTDVDTIQVTFDPVPIVDLGNDTALCQGQSYVLHADNPSATYLWNDNSTNPIHFVAFAGTYWVNVSINNCHASDTINISVLPTPAVDLGIDTSICTGEQFVLNVGQLGGVYLWQDNSADSLFTVMQQGKYWAQVTNNCGVASDTLNVKVKPNPTVNLGADQTLCDGETYLLDVTNPSAIYQWQDNSNSPTFRVKQTGTYAVSVTLNGCTSSDSVQMNFDNSPKVNFGNDTTICFNTTMILDASNNNATYLWNDGSTDPTLTVVNTGLQSVVVTIANCVGSDSIWIDHTVCGVFVEMPNIITPNGDGMNDTFVPISLLGVKDVTTIVYNRWGDEIFVSKDPQVKWEGKDKKGELVPTGVYYWTMNIDGVDGEKEQKRGSVTVTK
jgi:gliding motility-associated-like protein